jgi:hypothetical protein
VLDDQTIEPGSELPSSSDRVLDIWEIVKDAAISLAAARLMDYVGRLMPGFGEHYHRAEQHSVRLHRGAGRQP